MSTYIKTTEDGRRVEVIGRIICLDGKKETDRLVPVGEHPNRDAILLAVPGATHVAGRLPLTAEQATVATAALEQARLAYETSPKGLAERIRDVQNAALANRDG